MCKPLKCSICIATWRYLALGKAFKLQRIYKVHYYIGSSLAKHLALSFSHGSAVVGMLPQLHFHNLHCSVIYISLLLITSCQN